MTDKYQRLRDALAAGPTPGPWFQSYRKSVYGGYRTEVYTADGEVVATVAWYPRKLNDTTTTTDRESNARLISAACPDTIAALLDERDRLRAALQRVSLASKNSMSSKEECGRIARAALNQLPAGPENTSARSAAEKAPYSDIVSDGGMDPRNAADAAAHERQSPRMPEPLTQRTIFGVAMATLTRIQRNDWTAKYDEVIEFARAIEAEVMRRVKEANK